MENKCEYFDKCKKVSKYNKALETEDKNELNYVLTVCLDGGRDSCIKEQKSLDEKLEENLDG